MGCENSKDTAVSNDVDSDEETMVIGQASDNRKPAVTPHHRTNKRTKDRNETPLPSDTASSRKAKEKEEIRKKKKLLDQSTNGSFTRALDISAHTGKRFNDNAISSWYDGLKMPIITDDYLEEESAISSSSSRVPRQLNEETEDDEESSASGRGQSSVSVTPRGPDLPEQQSVEQDDHDGRLDVLLTVTNTTTANSGLAEEPLGEAPSSASTTPVATNGASNSAAPVRNPLQPIEDESPTHTDVDDDHSSGLLNLEPEKEAQETGSVTSEGSLFDSMADAASFALKQQVMGVLAANAAAANGKRSEGSRNRHGRPALTKSNLKKLDEIGECSQSQASVLSDPNTVMSPTLNSATRDERMPPVAENRVAMLLSNSASQQSNSIRTFNGIPLEGPAVAGQSNNSLVLISGIPPAAP